VLYANIRIISNYEPLGHKDRKRQFTCMDCCCDAALPNVHRGHGLWYVHIKDFCGFMHLFTPTGAIFMFIYAASPNQRSLGATNGLAQSLASIVRSLGPASGAGMLAVSVEHHLLGGYAVYVVMIILTAAACYLGSTLPSRPWNNK
jgi:hypothetical protein